MRGGLITSKIYIKGSFRRILPEDLHRRSSARILCSWKLQKKDPLNAIDNNTMYLTIGKKKF